MPRGTPRSTWSLGRITKVYPGQDGHAHAHKVISNENKYVRPISRLCLIEVITDDEMKKGQ